MESNREREIGRYIYGRRGVECRQRARGERARRLDAIGQMRYCRRSPSRFLVILTFPVAHIAHAIVVLCIRTRLPLCLRTLPTFLSPPKTTRFRCSPFAYYLSISVLLSAAVPIRATAVRSNALAKFPKDSSRSPLGSSALPRLSSSKRRPCSRSRFRRSDSSRFVPAVNVFVSCGSKRVLTAV